VSIQPTGKQLSLFQQAMQRQVEVEDTFSQKTIAKDENKYALLGVPFVIVGIVFQKPSDDPDMEIKDWVSLECVLGGTEDIEVNAKTGWIPNCRSYAGWHDSYPQYLPEEEFVLNDGGKGIRREIVNALHKNGHIVLGGDLTGTPRDGDQCWTDWHSFAQSEVRKDDNDEEMLVPSFHKSRDGGQLIIPVIRGLRASKDPKAPAGYSDTFYLS
jgi:hypothetical protein